MTELLKDFESIEKDYTEALTTVYDGKYKEALKQLEKIAGTDDLNPTIADRINTYIAVCHRALEEDGGTAETEEEVLALAAWHINRHETDEAIAVLDAADDKKYHAKDAVPYLRAMAAAIAEDYDAVLENLKKAIKANPDNKVLGSNNLLFVKAREENNKIAELLNVDDEKEDEEE